MEKNQIEELLDKYNAGLADPSEIALMEQLIERGEIQLTQLHELSLLDEQIVKADGPTPSMRLDDQFYKSLGEEKRKNSKDWFSFAMPTWNVLAPKLAFGLIILIAGFAGGYLLKGPNSSGEVKQLTEEVTSLKEMMLLSLLEKESATERLKAVSLSTEMNQVSQKVTRALFKTLNEDENANVRLAALEALTAYAKDSEVRKELVKSISIQDSPLVQVALAELMVAIQEKKSVKELQKLLQDDKTPKEVKNKIKNSINVLI
jgi:HEAT repeats